MRPLTRVLLSLLIAALAVPSAFAWGDKGHMIVNEAATLNLPTDMPQFFYEAFPDLIWLGPEPDRWKGVGESLDAANNPDHFLDYEYVSHLELPLSRYDYLALMDREGIGRRHGIDNADVGFLPWRIAEVTQKLQIAFRNWRLTTDPSERAIIERDVIHYAGILGHYAGDSANPHHSTMNYNGWVTPNPNGYAYDCGTHVRFESSFVSHAVDLGDVTPKVAAPVLHTDYFATAMAALKASNALVEPLYLLDRDGAFEQFGPVPPAGKAFASERLAAGASLLRDLWWSAWINSAKNERRERR